MNTISRGLMRALSMLLITAMLAPSIAACSATAKSKAAHIDSVIHRDGKVTDYTGIVHAPEGTDNQNRVEGRTYEPVLDANGKQVVDANGKGMWKQVGGADVTVTSGEDLGVKFGTAAISGAVGNIIGAGIIGSAIRGQKAPSATATGGCATSTSGTGANGGGC
jgi:hypothetical protein